MLSTAQVVSRGALLVGAAAREQFGALTVFAFASGLFAGCSHSRPAQVGMIPNREADSQYVNVGDCAPEFSYLNQGGQVKQLSDLRGQVILLLFPENPDWPDCERCHLFEQLASQLSCAYASVTVVSIATPDKPCAGARSAMRQCEVKGSAQLVALCDQSGRIRGLYGPGASGQCVLIDSDGTIRTRVRLDDINEIERMVRIVVSNHVFDYYRIRSPAMKEPAVQTGPAGNTHSPDGRTAVSTENCTGK